MNKTGYQPLPVLLRAEPSDARWTSKSAKILCAVATLGTLFALCGAVAICLIGFNASPRKTLESKAPIEVPSLPETTVSPAAATNDSNSTSPLLPDTEQAHRRMIADDHAIIEQAPAPALNLPSVPAPAPKAETPSSDSGLLNGESPAAGRVNLDRHLPEALRKNLEKTRREAERKRSRLEDLYRKHAISSEAYKKGEEKYQSEIERYRREMNARTEPKDDAAGQN